MPSRGSVLATTSGALAATLAGCNVLSAGGNGGPSDARRWLTQEVVRIPYPDPPSVGATLDDPLTKTIRTGRPIRALSVDGLSESALHHVSTTGSLDPLPVPRDQTEEFTLLREPWVALGEFDAPEPPANTTEAGTYRGVSLYTLEHSESYPLGPPFEGFAIADGTYAYVPSQPSAEAATAALRALLDAEAGDGTPVEGDGPVDRIWSYLEEGFWELYYATPQERGGISLRADAGTVHRRAIMRQPSETEAKELATFTEEQVANSGAADGGDRAPYNFDPYNEVTVNRDGRVITVEGSLPASAVASPEFQPP